MFQNGSVNVMYSTPSMYLEYVHRANSLYKIKNDDFFPYADQPWSFWTGTCRLLHILSCQHTCNMCMGFRLSYHYYTTC